MAISNPSHVTRESHGSYLNEYRHAGTATNLATYPSDAYVMQPRRRRCLLPAEEKLMLPSDQEHAKSQPPSPSPAKLISSLLTTWQALDAHFCSPCHTTNQEDLLTYLTSSSNLQRLSDNVEFFCGQYLNGVFTPVGFERILLEIMPVVEKLEELRDRVEEEMGGVRVRVRMRLM